MEENKTIEDVVNDISILSEEELIAYSKTISDDFDKISKKTKSLIRSMANAKDSKKVWVSMQKALEWFELCITFTTVAYAIAARLNDSFDNRYMLLNVGKQLKAEKDLMKQYDQSVQWLSFLSEDNVEAITLGLWCMIKAWRDSTEKMWDHADIINTQLNSEKKKIVRDLYSIKKLNKDD